MKRPLRASSRPPCTGDPPPDNWIGVILSVEDLPCQGAEGRNRTGSLLGSDSFGQIVYRRAKDSSNSSKAIELPRDSRTPVFSIISRN